MDTNGREEIVLSVRYPFVAVEMHARVIYTWTGVLFREVSSIQRRPYRGGSTVIGTV